MNKLVYLFFLPTVMSFAGFGDLLDDMLDKGVDKIADSVKEQIDEGQDFIRDGVDIARDMAETQISSAIHSKGKDSYWFKSQDFEKEDSLDRSIARFFKQFHSPETPASSPLQIQFFNPKAPSFLPFLEKDGATVGIPQLSLSDRPVDPLAGGLNTAKNMKEVLQSAADDHNPLYRYLVGLETTSPLIGSAVKQIATWANQLNAIGIQSYDLAALSSPGLWPKIQRGATYACEHELIAEGKDILQARTLCQKKSTRDEVLHAMEARNDQIFAGSFNVADKVLTQMGIKKGKELLMHITGTLVTMRSEKIEYYPPLHREVIALLQTGKEIKNGYQISGLKVERGPFKIGNKSQKEQILELFHSIQEKLKDDAEFSKEERSLLGSSHFPMASFITLMTQCKASISAPILEHYADLIAFERVMEFMEEAVQSILYKAESLRAAQISGYELDAYIKQVNGVLDDLRLLKMENLQKIASEQKALDAFVQIDQNLRVQARVGS